MTANRLLVIEDNPEILAMLAEYFSARGFQVTTALDAAAARAHVRESPPNLILMDVGLPDVDGFTLYRQLHRSPRVRHIPIIFLTMHSRRAEKLSGLGMGAVDYVTKPFDLEELHLRVQNAIARVGHQNLTDARTGLPSRRLVENELHRARGDNSRRAIHFHISHADAFRDWYGGLAGADVLRFTALLISRVLNELGDPEVFLGQSDDESFVVICSKDRAEPLVETVVSRFDADVEYHYAMARREGERITTRAANGREITLPVMRLEANEIPL